MFLILFYLASHRTDLGEAMEAVGAQHDRASLTAWYLVVVLNPSERARRLIAVIPGLPPLLVSGIKQAAPLPCAVVDILRALDTRAPPEESRHLPVVVRIQLVLCRT
jgi:hypothetical protein